MYEDVKEIYSYLKQMDKQNGQLREEESEFFADIGEY